jgi:nucleotide-binding universal stress UspA family protein
MNTRTRNAAKSKAATITKAAKPQLRFKTVLVPVDFSASSRRALDYAAGFAASHGGRLVLLHVVEPVVYPAELGYPSLGALPPQTEYERAGKEQLSLLARQVSGSVEVTAKIRVGQPYVEITRAARELGADLIIISTHGHTGLKRVLVGSTAERVVRHATVPVLTLRATESRQRR